MKPLQELQTILAKLTPEAFAGEDVVEAQAKIGACEELLDTFAYALKIGEGADPDDAKEYETSIKPLVAKMKKLAAKRLSIIE